jgi:hypothetical protein
MQLIAFKSVCVTQLCAVFRIHEANVRSLPIRGAVTKLEFSRDTLTFVYVVDLYVYSVVRYTIIFGQHVVKICMQLLQH